MTESSDAADVVIAQALTERWGGDRVARLAAWVAAGGSPDDLRRRVLAALADPTADTRRRALRLVADLPGDPSAYRDPVVGALADSGWTVREAAAVAAGLLHDPNGTIFRLLVAASLADPKPLVRRAAAESAGPRIDPERDYGAAIRHPFERQRMRAALAVAHAPPERAAEAIMLLRVPVADSHPKVRRAALRGISLVPRVAARALLPVVARKCSEADAAVADAARKVWDELLHPRHADEPLLPLRQFAGGSDAAGLRAAVEALPSGHPLRVTWESLRAGTPESDPRRFARLLARLCERVLGQGS